MKETIRLSNPFLAAGLAVLVIAPLLGCTIFVLVDDEHTLFFNNENTSSSNTHIWFIPEGEDHYGAVYVGLDDGGAQGGMNTAGLAIDWVAQFDEEWEDTGSRPMVRGNYGERMLEQCATVAEAVAFFKKYYHPTFAGTRALIADRSGASAIIGAEDGRAYIDWSNESRGFGTGFDDRMMKSMATNPPRPTIENGFRMLQELKEGGGSPTPTRYSSAFDLRTGEIYVMHEDASGWVTLRLEDELALGPHYYTVKSLHEEEPPKPRPLKINMHRSLADAFPPLDGQHAELTTKMQRVLTDLQNGTSKPGAFNEEFWAAINPELEDIRSELTMLGDLQSIVLVGFEPEKAAGVLYRVDFPAGVGIVRISEDMEGRISDLAFEAFEPKGRD
jgi:hypothetical protein